MELGDHRVFRRMCPIFSSSLPAMNIDSVINQNQNTLIDGKYMFHYLYSLN